MPTTTWKVDSTHSEFQFKVRHLMISNVTGHFRKFDVEAETEADDFSQAKNIVATAEIDSIDTNNEQRDSHLKSADFFAQEDSKHLKFEGKKLQKDGDKYILHGNLTIRNITRPVTLAVEYAGIVQDTYGQTKAGFTVTGKILRKEYGLTWDAVTEAGHIVASDEVKIMCEVQLIKQA